MPQSSCLNIRCLTWKGLGYALKHSIEDLKMWNLPSARTCRKFAHFGFPSQPRVLFCFCCFCFVFSYFCCSYLHAKHTTVLYFVFIKSGKNVFIIFPPFPVVLIPLFSFLFFQKLLPDQWVHLLRSTAVDRAKGAGS